MSRLNLDVPDPTWIGDDQAASELLRLALRKVEEDPHDFIGYDLETHAMKIPLGRGPKKDPLDWMNDTVTFWGLSFKTDGKYERYCLDQQHFQYFIPLLENPKANLVTWNGKYDAHVSENSGVNVWESNYMDFQVCAQMLNENVQLGGMDLKKAAFRGFDSEWRKARTGNKKTDDIVPWSAIPMTKFKDIFGDKDIHGDKAVEFVTSLYNLPRDLVVNYTSLDPYATVLLAEHMREVMLAHDLSEHSGYENMWEYFTEFEVFMTEILWRMERRGLEIDVEALKAKIEPMEQELEEIQAEINSFAGRPVNLHPSSKDLQELLFGHGPGCLGLTPKKMTKGGATEPKPSTNKEVLTEYAAEGVEIAQYIQRFRKVDKIKGTYVVALISLVEHYGDGRIHPTFKQYGARTGRFSTKDPNSQNFPRPDTDEFGIRQAFIAREGYILIVADYGQLEMRIMAHFSQDPTMLDAIRRGLDLHSVSVEKMYGIPYEDVVGAKKRSDIVKWDELTDYEKDCLLKRQRCKNTGFAILYGGGAKRVSDMLEITRDEAKELINKFFRAYPGVPGWQKDNLWRCRKHLFVTTLLGRRRNLPEINSSQWSTKSEAEREANNSVIQGSAADITKAAMINCERDEELNQLAVEQVNQIHDEIVFECPQGNEEIAMEQIKRLMERPFDLSEDPLDVPTPVDIKAVHCWADAK